MYATEMTREIKCSFLDEYQLILKSVTMIAPDYTKHNSDNTNFGPITMNLLHMYLKAGVCNELTLVLQPSVGFSRCFGTSGCNSSQKAKK
jgi:hypothetical protein